MNEQRLQKIHDVVRRSQKSLSVILENITDPHNIGAILRTADAVGIRKVFVINTTTTRQSEILVIGKRTSSGTRKWVDVAFFDDLDKGIAAVRLEHSKIYGTALSSNSTSHFDQDFTLNCAIFLGNEKEGLSEQAKAHCDQLITIPQMGMAQSLNVSVAGAVILYEACRQRKEKGFYTDKPDLSPSEIEALTNEFIRRSDDLKNMPSRLKYFPIDSDKTL